MKWRGFATDFDGTIATDGLVDRATMDALRRLGGAGVRMFLVTGRELKDFRPGADLLGLFDGVVAENGAVLYAPRTGETRALGPAPPPEFVEELVRLGVQPLSVGACIVATVEPHELTVLEVIKAQALEMQVVFNKGAVMVLPAGVNKATGLAAALEPYGLTTADIVGVGDAENDDAFLAHCGLSAAVANALPALKERVGYVASLDAGAGVAEVIGMLLDGAFDDLPREIVP